MDQDYLCADLYDAALLLSYGAKFKRVESYYRNRLGKSFSIMSFTEVTWEMLQALESPSSTVNFHKFREYRKRLKTKAEKYASEHDYTEISSAEVYKIRQQLRKQTTRYKQLHNSSGPKRIMPVDEYAKEASPTV